MVLQYACEFRYLFDIQISYPSDIYQEVEMLDHVGGSIFTFKGPSQLFSIMAILTFSPTSTVKMFYFLQILSNVAYLLMF
jgi:hypothetical protein